jgi:hypothetical protein
MPTALRGGRVQGDSQAWRLCVAFELANGHQKDEARPSNDHTEQQAPLANRRSEGLSGTRVEQQSYQHPHACRANLAASFTTRVAFKQSHKISTTVSSCHQVVLEQRKKRYAIITTSCCGAHAAHALDLGSHGWGAPHRRMPPRQWRSKRRPFPSLPRPRGALVAARRPRGPAQVPSGGRICICSCRMQWTSPLGIKSIRAPPGSLEWNTPKVRL